MLSLRIKEGDYFMIGDDVHIHVPKQKAIGRFVQLMIEAPKTVPVMRSKPYEERLMEAGGAEVVKAVKGAKVGTA